MMKRIQPYIQKLQQFSDRLWFPPLVAALAALDNLIMIIPTDGILISSTMLRPRRWFTFALTISLGSTLGALALAALVELHGLPMILHYYPTLDQTLTWQWTERFWESTGLAIVFLVALTPLPQQPTVILASLAYTPLWNLSLAVFAGRFLKYLLMAYLASHAPGVLKRLWGVRGEMEDVGL